MNPSAIAGCCTLSTYGNCCTLVYKRHWYHWVREATSSKRATAKDGSKEIHTLSEDPILPFTIDNIDDGIASIETVPQEPKATATFHFDTNRRSIALPPGSLIIPDPYEMYLRSLPEGQSPDTLVVTKES